MHFVYRWTHTHIFTYIYMCEHCNSYSSSSSYIAIILVVCALDGGGGSSSDTVCNGLFSSV